MRPGRFPAHVLTFLFPGYLNHLLTAACCFIIEISPFLFCTNFSAANAGRDFRLHISDCAKRETEKLSTITGLFFFLTTLRKCIASLMHTIPQKHFVSLLANITCCSWCSGSTCCILKRRFVALRMRSFAPPGGSVAMWRSTSVQLTNIIYSII